MDELFQQVAADVAARIADLLAARVAVVDAQGVAVAHSEPRTARTRSGLSSSEPESEYLRVSLDVRGQMGEVVVFAPGGQEVMSPRVAQFLVELMIDQRLAAIQSNSRHEARSRFIQDLLSGTSTLEQEMAREARSLGVDLSGRRVVVLIDAAGYVLASMTGRRLSEASVRQRAQVVISSIARFSEEWSDALCAYMGEGRIAALAQLSCPGGDGRGRSERDATDEVRQRLREVKRSAAGLLEHLHNDLHRWMDIGIGRHHDGPLGLAHSYVDAQMALSLGRLVQGEEHVHSIDDLAMAVFVGAAEHRAKVDLARQLLAPLEDEPHLVQTLELFFQQDASASTAASRLSIHRNTLGYRLDRITALTGLDPRRFDDAVQLRLALFLRRQEVSLAKA